MASLLDLFTKKKAAPKKPKGKRSVEDSDLEMLSRMRGMGSKPTRKKAKSMLKKRKNK